MKKYLAWWMAGWLLMAGGPGWAEEEPAAPAAEPAAAVEEPATAPAADTPVAAEEPAAPARSEPAAPAAESAPANAAEIIRLLQQHYVDRSSLDVKQLQEASIAGIVRALGAGARLLTPDEVGSMAGDLEELPAAGGPLARAEVIAPNFVYLRLADVAEEAGAALDAELKKLAAQETGGYILDLRFADGTNYAAAAAVASRFLKEGQELFSVVTAEGQRHAYRSELTEGAKTVAPTLGGAPLLVLVNARTRGSAEALAGVLRAQERCILVGHKTAGTAAAWEDIKLGDNQILRVATAKVVLAVPAANDLPAEVFPAGLAPDIPVTMDPAVERDVVLHSSTNLTLTASLEPQQVKKRLSEAELVRAFRGEAVETPRPGGESDGESELEPVRDVVLQRAVDVLKGIRVLLSWR